MEDDDSFDWIGDKEGIDVQWKATLVAVKKYKDHPALLMWGVANEVILNMETEPEKIAYSKFLEKLCAEIKKTDPNHLISSASAWVISAKYWAKYVPSIDVYGCNVYGGGASIIDREVRKLAPNKPYMITEFGAQGEWEVPKDGNGLPIEPSDTVKFETIANGWRDWIKPKNNCLGGFVFNYGNDWNHLSVWLSLKMKEFYRPMYWATKRAFTEDYSITNPIEILEYELQADKLKNGWVPVSIKTSKASKDLEIEMYYNHRKGSRKYRDALFPLEIKGNLKKGVFFRPAKIADPVKVYVFLSDKENNLGIAQKSFVMEQGGGIGKELKEKSGVLPLVVYSDYPRIGEDPYYNSGWMGDIELLEMDLENKEEVKNGLTSLKVTFSAFKASQGWVGCAWQHPLNNWGDEDGGYDLSGATKLTFWAKGKYGGEVVTFSYGILRGNDKKYRDSSTVELKDVKLKKKWKKYTINLKNKDLRKIITGFAFFTGAKIKPVTFYLDDIIFE